jgi:N-acetylneuraminic acid mutarotase
MFGLAYDPVRKLTYLFGGSSDSADTWAWDGQFWVQVAPFGPAKRVGHSMTFDTARKCAVLFGGTGPAGQALQDTWLFDGAEWTQVEDIGPSPRTGHQAAYDENRGRLVLFGGYQFVTGNNGVVGDTWEWDGASWTQVEEIGPAARQRHSMAYDSAKKRIVMFGGQVRTGGANQPVNDTWEWDGTQWTQVADTGPTARARAAMTSIGGTLVLHGGDSQQTFDDTWQWSAGTWLKVQDIGPLARRSHAMSYDTVRNRIVLFGGEIETVDAGGNAVVNHFGDTWEAPAQAAAGGGGAIPIPKNLTISPNPFSMSGPASTVVVEFDIEALSAPMNYGIYMGPPSPSPPVNVILGVAYLPVGATHGIVNVDRALIAQAVESLHISLPAPVPIRTTPEGESVQLSLTA